MIAYIPYYNIAVGGWWVRHVPSSARFVISCRMDAPMCGPNSRRHHAPTISLLLPPISDAAVPPPIRSLPPDPSLPPLQRYLPIYPSTSAPRRHLRRSEASEIRGGGPRVPASPSSRRWRARPQARDSASLYPPLPSSNSLDIDLRAARCGERRP